MAKWQRISIEIPKKFGPTERKAIAQDVIDFIVERTRDGKDIKGKSFPGKYSDSYRKSLDYKIAGKPKSGRPIDLTLTGNMLDSLELLSESSGKLLIGYPKGDKINGQVEGNRLGTYGSSTPKKSIARDFLGIDTKDLEKILEQYKGEDAEQTAQENLKQTQLAKKFVKGI